MENIVYFITQGAQAWTPDIFIRMVFTFAVLEGIFTLGALMLYVGKGR